MRVCIPTIDNRKELSEVCDHFGSAPYFTIFDFETNRYETVSNSDKDHEHGTCHPTDKLKDKGIDCVICRGLGRRALEKLNASGINVFRADQSTAKDMIVSFSKRNLEQFDPENACRSHRCR